jgi:hypothetical protein
MSCGPFSITKMNEIFLIALASAQQGNCVPTRDSIQHIEERLVYFYYVVDQLTYSSSIQYGKYANPNGALVSYITFRLVNNGFLCPQPQPQHKGWLRGDPNQRQKRQIRNAQIDIEKFKGIIQYARLWLGVPSHECVKSKLWYCYTGSCQIKFRYNEFEFSIEFEPGAGYPTDDDRWQVIKSA